MHGVRNVITCDRTYSLCAKKSIVFYFAVAHFLVLVPCRDEISYENRNEMFVWFTLYSDE